MKRGKRWGVGIVMQTVLCFLLFFASLAEAVEVKNGDFEEWKEGLPTGWKANKEKITQDTPAYQGKSSLLIKLIGKSSCEMTQEEKIPVEKGKIYELKFFFRKEKDCRLMIYLRNYEKDGVTKDRPVLVETALSDDWTERVMKFTPKEGTEGISIIFRASSKIDSRIWIDAVSLKELGGKQSGPVDSKELLGNPGMESYVEGDKMEAKSVYKNWRLNNVYPASVTIMIDPEKAHSGEKFILAEQETEKQGVVYQEGVEVDFQKKYRFSVWAKGEGTLHMFLYQHNMRRFVFSEVVLRKGELTEDWQEYSGSFSPSSSLITKVSPALHFEGEIYLDDVSFKEVE